MKTRKPLGSSERPASTRAFFRQSRAARFGEAGEAGERSFFTLAPVVQRAAGPVSGRGSQAEAPVAHPRTSPGAESASSSVERVLSAPGSPLDRGTRSLMEARLGHDFEQVRVHAGADAEASARELGARAFTLGSRVVFGGGEHAPQTRAGRRLLAHELAHVVQQGAAERLPTAGARPGPALRAPAGRVQRDQQVKMERWEERLDEMLPGKVGLVHHIFRITSVEGALGTERLKEVVDLIYADKRARELVKTHGVAAIVAMDETRQGSTLEVARAAQSLKNAPLRFGWTAQALRGRERERTAAFEPLAGASSWAEEQAKAQKRSKVTQVVGLDAKQGASILAVAGKLSKLAPSYQTAEKELAQVKPKLQEARAHALEARKRSSSNDELLRLEMRGALLDADASLSAAIDPLKKAAEHVTLFDQWEQMEAIRGELEALRKGQASDVFDAFGRALDGIRAVLNELPKIEDRAHKAPEALERVAFVLRYFLALNKHPGVQAPTEAEEAKHGSRLTALSEDIKLIVADGGMRSHYALFVAAARAFEEQIAVRTRMKAATGTAADLVPTQVQVADYFTALLTQDNPKVFSAYSGYAGAFFYHQGTARKSDLNVGSLSDVFQRQVSIAALRPLVCTGYAVLGAELTRFAGATLIRYIGGVRASDEQLVEGNAFTDAHALAKLTRKGQTYFVSNEDIVFKQEDGLGPDAVAWAEPSNRLFTAGGGTIAEVTSGLEGVVAAERPRARARLKAAR